MCLFMRHASNQTRTISNEPHKVGRAWISLIATRTNGEELVVEIEENARVVWP
ncbi:hypothetical protein BC827DRAFT_1234183 [Russula dissimulans]|nr:hypothetical protein BC827DRAFT_1251140 [Russula dissimulans]KAH9955987.1 hypothetical protein BC827DRAFT_1234183 [Russula dissimulans]